MVTLLITSEKINAQLNWVNIEGFGNTSVGIVSTNRMVLDEDENMYVAGTFNEPVIIGSFSLIPTDPVNTTNDISLTKYSSNGDVIWSKQLGGTNEDRLSEIVVVDGYIYVTGTYFDGATEFDGQLLTSPGLTDAFLVKLDTNGDVIWATSSNGQTSHVESFGLTVDAMGNSYITGSFDYEIHFGNLSLLNSSGWSYTDGFIAKFDALGTPVWSKLLGGSGNNEGFSMSHSNGQLFISGHFYGNMTVDGFTLYTSGNCDLFVGKLTTDGDFLWLQSEGGTGVDVAFDIESDDVGNIYLGGYFTGQSNFGGQVVNATNNYSEAYLARYTTNGGITWIEQTSSTDFAVINDIYLATNGNDVYVAGEYGAGTTTIGTQSVPGLGDPGDPNILVSKCDVNGDFSWAKYGGGTSFERATGICSLQDGRVFATGYMLYDGQFDCINVTSTGSLGGLQQLYGEIDVSNPVELSLGNDSLMCQGETLTLVINYPNNSCVWQDGSTDSIFVVSDSGIYWVEIETGGCTIADTVQITYSNLTSFSFPSSDDTSFCENESITLHAPSDPTYNYLWQDGSTDSLYTTSESGTYWVTVSDICDAFSDTIELISLPIPAFDLGNDTTLCAGESLELNLTIPDATYQWQNGSNTSNQTISSQGDYWLTVDLNGCVGTDTISINYTEAPLISLGNDTVLCNGTEMELLPYSPSQIDNYLWQDMSASNSYTVNSPGIYWLMASNECGSSSDTINIEYSLLEDINLGTDTSICSGTSLLLDIATNGATYTWQDNSIEGTLTVTNSGSYSVTVEMDGCYERDTIVVSMLNLPTVYLGNDTTLCLGNSLSLNLFEPEMEYLWQNGYVEPWITIADSGTYWLRMSNECGYDIDTICIQYEDCQCTVYIPNSFTPQNDGINDLFGPEYYCDILESEFIIYNRWGEIIFQSSDLNEKWDGSYDGALSPDGVYTYSFYYKTYPTKVEVLEGHITLIR